MKNPFFFKRHAMGGIVCLRVFEDEERSWSDNNARCITQVKTYARQRKISKSHASSWSSQVPRALREGESGAGPRTGPARRAGGRVCWRRTQGQRKNVGGGTSRLSAEDSGKRDALAPSSQGSAAAHAVRRWRRRGALQRSWPWGPWVLFFCAHSICDNSRGWREDGRTTAIEVDG